MNHLPFTGVSALTLFAMAEAGKERIIPLKDIWAFEMPGTRIVRELEPDKFGPKVQKLSSAEQIALSEKSLTSQILNSLGRNKQGQSATQAFAVPGTGVDALRKAAEVLSGKKQPQTSFVDVPRTAVDYLSVDIGSTLFSRRHTSGRTCSVSSHDVVPIWARTLVR